MTRRYIPKSLRIKVIEQARYRCGYCLSSEKISGIPLEIEHIYPIALGGLTEEENLWAACTTCNDIKNDRVTALDPETRIITSIFNPYTQTWAEHFSWSQSGTLVIGLTETGRATIAALNLNRPALVAAREQWVMVGWHPPKESSSTTL